MEKEEFKNLKKWAIIYNVSYDRFIKPTIDYNKTIDEGNILPQYHKDNIEKHNDNINKLLIEL